LGEISQRLDLALNISREYSSKFSYHAILFRFSIVCLSSVVVVGALKNIVSEMIADIINLAIGLSISTQCSLNSFAIIVFVDHTLSILTKGTHGLENHHTL